MILTIFGVIQALVTELERFFRKGALNDSVEL